MGAPLAATSMRLSEIKTSLEKHSDGKLLVATTRLSQWYQGSSKTPKIGFLFFRGTEKE
jgi:hypothetical protein